MTRREKIEQEIRIAEARSRKAAALFHTIREANRGRMDESAIDWLMNCSDDDIALLAKTAGTREPSEATLALVVRLMVMDLRAQQCRRTIVSFNRQSVADLLTDLGECAILTT